MNMSDARRATRVRKLRAMAADVRLPAEARATYAAAADRISADLDETTGGGWWYPPSYDALIAAMGYDVLADLDIGSYQGDSLVAVRDGSRYGLLTYGWGSCSGCDSLEACSNDREVDELREQLRSEVIWIDGLAAFKEMVRTRDWGAVSYVDADAAAPFVAAVLALPQTAIPATSGAAA